MCILDKNSVVSGHIFSQNKIFVINVGHISNNINISEDWCCLSYDIAEQLLKAAVQKQTTNQPTFYLP